MRRDSFLFERRVSLVPAVIRLSNFADRPRRRVLSNKIAVNHFQFSAVAERRDAARKISRRRHGLFYSPHCDIEHSREAVLIKRTHEI